MPVGFRDIKLHSICHIVLALFIQRVNVFFAGYEEGYVFFWCNKIGLCTNLGREL